eukprot:CAMPEP_0171117042 /NCGR_PEP_ID=MMETSP0766_2-20121228/91578_1 /TAXON_ID=439317 /ORGANISM="Gambierdiscus australes, Strain CAWD 149" /LENGTH=94 /DNA_ID=CAMNT_0011579529 /DNA_START=119 /DNA_END=399 /DNA_ORIENTATION=+
MPPPQPENITARQRHHNHYEHHDQLDHEHDHRDHRDKSTGQSPTTSTLSALPAAGPLAAKGRRAQLEVGAQHEEALTLLALGAEMWPFSSSSSP